MTPPAADVEQAAAAIAGGFVGRARNALRVAPTRRLPLALLATAPAWLWSRSDAGLAAAASLGGAVLLAAAADALFAPAAADFDVSRRLPRTLGLGDETDAEYEVRSRLARGARVRLFDRLPPAVARMEDGRPLPSVPAPVAAEQRLDAGESLTLPVRVSGRVRGVHALGPLALEVRGPLGLVRRTLRYATADDVAVAPSASGVRRYRLLALQHRLRDAGVRVTRRRGGGTSFANLREYAVGDDPRHIDWKATARRGRAITREYAVEQGQTILIAVDAGRLMTQLAGDRSRFEHALASALVLADVAAHSGDQVGAMVFDDEVRVWVPPQRGAQAMRLIREALVPVQATMAEPDYAAAFRALDARHRKRSLLVLFTDVIDVRSSNALIANTARGAARHLPLVVALRNDAVLAAARPSAERLTSGALYEAAAAEEMLLARAEALARMRQAGVQVVDVSPQSMTAAVVNRYLELKGRSAV